MLGILYFTASWCGPCKVFGPTITKFAEENGIELTKVDVDADQKRAAEYDVMSIPTTIWYKDGKPIMSQIGVLSLVRLHEVKHKVETS